MEEILPDDYPLQYGFLYVVGDKPFQNFPDFKTVKEMRDELVKMKLEKPDVEIKKCNISARDLWEYAL